MAFNSHLLIQAAGEDAPILFGEDTTHNNQGETDVSAWLECSEFEAALEISARGIPGSSRYTSQRTWRPARFVLRLGKSTPWLFEAGRTNNSIDLTLHLFHRHHETGVIEQSFQYRIRRGRIASVRIVQPNVHHPDTASLSPLVELAVVPGTVEIESMTGGTLMIDDGSAIAPA